MSRRHPSLRTRKTFDTFVVKTGSAGFVQLFKNGRRIQPKNVSITLRRRKEVV